MTSPNRKYLLGHLLKSVSRSFYLTLRILPPKLREPIGIAYLLARAADTIADTPIISPQHRIELLLALRAEVNGVGDGAGLAKIRDEVAGQQLDSSERTLLVTLLPVVTLLNSMEQNDRTAACEVLSILSAGMEFDLQRFPDEGSAQVVALDTLAELDQYTYMVAGCVGEFWTRISCRHEPRLQTWDAAKMSRCGVRFGMALQMTNVLRDCAKDLRIGRCYLPREMLAAAGLTPEDLLQPNASLAARPVLMALTRHALEHFREAERYTIAIPASCLRLRLASLWPILIGLQTLDCHLRNEAWLDPQRPSRIRRSAVYRIMARSLLVAGSDRMVRRWIQRLISGIEVQLNSCPPLPSRLA